MKFFPSIHPETAVVPFHPQNCLDLGCENHSIFLDSPQIANKCFAADMLSAQAFVTLACRAEQLPFADGSFQLCRSPCIALLHAYSADLARTPPRSLAQLLLVGDAHRRNEAYARMARSVATLDIVDVLGRSPSPMARFSTLPAGGFHGAAR